MNNQPEKSTDQPTKTSLVCYCGYEQKDLDNFVEFIDHQNQCHSYNLLCSCINPIICASRKQEGCHMIHMKDFTYSCDFQSDKNRRLISKFKLQDVKSFIKRSGNRLLYEGCHQEIFLYTALIFRINPITLYVSFVSDRSYVMMQKDLELKGLNYNVLNIFSEKPHPLYFDIFDGEYILHALRNIDIDEIFNRIIAKFISSKKIYFGLNYGGEGFLAFILRKIKGDKSSYNSVVRMLLTKKFVCSGCNHFYLLNQAPILFYAISRCEFDHTYYTMCDGNRFSSTPFGLAYFKHLKFGKIIYTIKLDITFNFTD